MKRAWVLFSFIAIFPNFSYASNVCNDATGNHENALLFQAPFSEWSDEKLIEQTHKNYEYLKARPYSYPQVDSKVDGAIVIGGMPRGEVNLYIKQMTPEEIKKQTFRFFTTKEGLKQIHESRRLTAQPKAYREIQYYYKDMSGILMSPTDVDVHDAYYWQNENRFWIDVKLDPRTVVLKVDKASFLIPGSPPIQKWLVDSVVKSMGVNPSKTFDEAFDRMNAIGWSAMEIPIVEVVDASDDAARAAALRARTEIAPQFKDKPLFEMFYGLKDEQTYAFGKNVHYLSAEERQAYRISCDEQGRLIDANGKLFNSPSGGAAGVLSPTGEVFMSSVGRASKGLIQHSSYLAGGPVLAAFVFTVKDGVLTLGTNQSGHYLTIPEAVSETTLGALKAMGCDTSQFVFKPF